MSGISKKKSPARNATGRWKPWTGSRLNHSGWDFASAVIVRKKSIWDAGWHAIIKQRGAAILND
jgi:hypothetical protein